LKTAFWGAALGVAVLWPAKLAGPLDGAPLDSPLEAVLIGLALPALIWFHPQGLRTTAVRVLIVALLAWHAVTAVAVTQDGWCLRFTSPEPLFVDDLRVPHSWDVRADWRATVPRCSAVMSRGYSEIERFPAWFYNLPPNDLNQPAEPRHRPPEVTARLDLGGVLHVPEPGVLAIAIDDGVRLDVAIDGASINGDIVSGVPVPAGTHQVDIIGTLTGSHWRLMPSWNGRPLWSAAVATMQPPSALDLAIRPWARWIPALLISALVAGMVASIARVAATALIAAAVAAVVVLAMAATGRGAIMRLTPLVLLYAVLVPLPRRLQNVRGMMLLLGVPFLALFAVLGAPQAGVFTWYSSGDDWWNFQRYAYRIYLQGYWLEGGERTFWFQPLYRWIAGALHLAFGDSSVGELFWDAAGTFICAVFAFQMARVVAGFRWGIAAAVMVLAVLTLGPAWYLFGRGLSEISSAGFLYAAALFAMRGRQGHVLSIAAAGLLAVLAFYTRLNSLPMVIALLTLAWPPWQPIASIRKPAALARTVARPLLAGLIAAIAIGLVLFTARTYYYTGVFNMFEGTQAGHLSVWQVPDGGGSIAGNVLGSLGVVLTMSDPPKADVRALPIVIGVLAAIGGLAGIARLRQLPLSAVALCLAGLSGALVARGTAYPGRFSVQLVPVASALTIAAVALVCRGASATYTARLRRQIAADPKAAS
jgi:hypothetical protein